MSSSIKFQYVQIDATGDSFRYQFEGVDIFAELEESIPEESDPIVELYANINPTPITVTFEDIMSANTYVTEEEGQARRREIAEGLRHWNEYSSGIIEKKEPKEEKVNWKREGF